MNIYGPTVKQDLLKLLKQKTKYSYNNLKTNLIVESDDTMISLFLEILQEFIDTYNIETPVYYHKYILKIIEYFYINIENFEISGKEDIISKLKSLEYSTSRVLSMNYEEKNKKIDITKPVCISNKAFLLNLINELKHISYLFKGITEENLQKFQYELLEVTELCIFEFKDFNCFLDIIKNSNYISTNDKLIKKVLEQYKNTLLNSKNQNDIIYYHKVMQKFIDAILQKESDMLIDIEKEIKQLRNLAQSDMYSIEKQKQVYLFTDEILNQMHRKTTPYNKVLDNLKKKYQIEGELKIFPKDTTSWKNYKLNKSMVITIDNPKARLLENAISLEQFGHQYHLQFYITDVMAYTEMNPDFERHIIDRAFSIKGYPILPNQFTLQKLSLTEGKYRKVIAFLFTLDENLQVVNFKVERQMIKVKHNLSFEQVFPILKESKSTQLKNMLSLLYNVSLSLNLNSKKVKEYHEMKEISKEILYNASYINNYGQVLVSIYQIFLNAFVASECSKNGYPYLYRNNEFFHNQEKIAEISKRYQNNPELDDVIHLLNTIYIPSTYSTINKGHKGLDKTAYGEVSRPCRSAASYINLKQVTEYYIDGFKLNEESKKALLYHLEKECIHINQKRELYDDYQKELVKVKKQKVKNNK